MKKTNKKGWRQAWADHKKYMRDNPTEEEREERQRNDDRFRFGEHLNAEMGDDNADIG